MPNPLLDALSCAALKLPLPPSHTPHLLRLAISRIDSDNLRLRRQAEFLLHQYHAQAVPLLEATARRSDAPRRSLWAALLLYKLGPQTGSKQSGRGLKDQEADAVRAARISLMRLEQVPESVPALIQFRQALELLRLIPLPLPPALLSRALVVRTVGGENLSLVRQVLAAAPDALIEHTCIARQQAILTLIHFEPHDKAFHLLARNLAHPSPSVKLTAMYGLRQLGDARAVPLLLPYIQDASCPVSQDAAELCYFLGRERGAAVTLLRGSVPHDDAVSLLRSALPCDRLDSRELLRPKEPSYPH